MIMANDSVVFGALVYLVPEAPSFVVGMIVGLVFRALRQKGSWDERKRLLVDVVAGLALGIVCVAALRLLVASKAVQVIVVVVACLACTSLNAVPAA